MMFGYSRGERNNNPLNIRISPEKFQGEIIPSKDKAFKQFTTEVMGIRAGAVILGNYHKHHGLSTIAQIVSRWAPPTENDTTSYVRAVCRDMGVTADAKLDFSQSSTLPDLIKALIEHENGQNIYTDAQINEAVDMTTLTSS